jgi:hypothetical protein
MARPQEKKDARRGVSRTLVNFWLDAALLVMTAIVIWISAMLRIVFPAPSAASGWQLWGLSFDDWYNLQFYALCVLVLLAVEHLVLHWNWVCSVIATQLLHLKSRPDEGVQAVYGVGTFIIILAVCLGTMLMALFSVQGPPP